MEMRPEQVTALEYLRRKGTEAPAAEIRSRLVRTFEELDELLAGVPAELARRRPEPGRWSVQEVADHLIVSHRPATEQLALLVAGESPPGGPVPAGLQSTSPLEEDWPSLRRELAEVHRRFVEVFDRASDGTPLEARAPIEMVVKCATADAGGSVPTEPVHREPVHWVERFDWKAFALAARVHALEHVAQVRAILAALDAAGEGPGVA